MRGNTSGKKRLRVKKTFPFPRSILLVSAHHGCWSHIKEPVCFPGPLFSCIVGYWLHNLIKAVTKWTLQCIFSQPHGYWLLLFPPLPSSLYLWKVHYLQLLQNQSELAKISDGIYSIINAHGTNAVTHERLGNVLLSDPSTFRGVLFFYPFNRITLSIFWEA